MISGIREVENWTPNEKGRLSLAHGGLGHVSHDVGGGQMEKPE